MRNLLALGAAALLIFLGLGWYLDWYRLKTTQGEDGHRQINIDLNTNKITEDVNNEKKKVVNWLSKDSNSPTTQVTPGTPTGFRPGSDNGFTPVAPSSGPVLPQPQ
jgi:hypothetical protein